MTFTTESIHDVSSFLTTEEMAWHNGEKTESVFSAAEYDRRLKIAQNCMQASNLDAIVVTSYHNICYFTGFMYCAFGRPYAAVIRADGTTTTIAANIDGGHPWRRSQQNAVNYTDWKKTNFFATLAKRLTGAKRVGVEYDHLTLQRRMALEEQLPAIEIADIGEQLMWARTIKSQEEIDHITFCTSVANIGGNAVKAAVAPGVPEHEVALASTAAMTRAIAAQFSYAELMDTWTWFQSGINTDGAHNPVTNRKVQAGDILSLNCFPMVFGYYVALERTLFCDHVPTDEAMRIWENLCEVHRQGMAMLVPGAKCSEIAHALNALMHEFGLLKYRSFGYGHSFGILSHYYGREAGVELREDIDTVLEAGMIVSMEPMVTVPEGQAGAGGYREHDILVITEQGNTNITNFPFGPEENIIK